MLEYLLDMVGLSEKALVSKLAEILAAANAPSLLDDASARSLLGDETLAEVVEMTRRIATDSLHAPSGTI